MPWNDYPQAMTNNARRGRELNKKHGMKCATAVGRRTGAILAAGGTLSNARVRRMYAFLSRAETYYNPSDSSACGTISFLLWGGLAAKRWAKSKVAEMDKRNEQMVVELRNKYGEDVEVRTAEIRAHESQQMVVEGYASVFDSVYNIGFDETVDRGAFDNVLDDDVRFFFDHGGTPLARTKNGTLQLSVDETGLHYRAELNDTTAGRDLFAAIQRGDVSESSFAFIIEKEQRDAAGVRHIEKVGRLLDCSAVSYPASPATSVESRTKKEIETQPQTTKLRQNHTDMELGKMTVSDLKAKRGQFSDEFNALAAGIEAEGRTATPAEAEQLNHLDKEVERLDSYIETREKQAKQAARMAHVGTVSNSEQKEVRAINQRFSLSRAITHVANGRPLMGAELEWAMEAQQEARGSGLRMEGQIGVPTFAVEQRAADDFQSGGSGAGFVPELVPTAIDALHTPSFIERLGVQFINATGNIQMPRVSTRPGVTQEGEVDGDANSAMDIDEVSLTPTRYAAKTKYSKQLLMQGGAEVDTFIARQIINAHNRQMDSTALAILTATAATDIAGTTSSGMFNDQTATEFVEATLFAMESALVSTDTDFGNVQVVVGPRGLQAIRDLSATGAGGDALYNGTTLMGYNVTKSGRVTEGTGVCTILVGNFGQALIGAAFGPLDVLVDPYSSASTAQIALHTNKWFDVDLRQAGAMATSTLALVD